MNGEWEWTFGAPLGPVYQRKRRSGLLTTTASLVDLSWEKPAVLSYSSSPETPSSKSLEASMPRSAMAALRLILTRPRSSMPMHLA